MARVILNRITQYLLDDVVSESQCGFRRNMGTIEAVEDARPVSPPIMGISWEDRVPNTEVLHRANMPGVEALIIKAQLRWVGHVVRMDDTRLPKMIFFSELASGTRNIGHPLKRFKDCLKASLGAYGLSTPNLETLAVDRCAWRLGVHRVVQAFEKKRLQDLDRKRQARKERKPDPTVAVACPQCCRICASSFGLRSHRRIH